MIKKEVQEIIKEVLELGSLKEADEYAVGLSKVIKAIGDKLEEKPESEASDKAVLGSLVIDKRFVKGRAIRNPRTGESLGTSEDKYTVKVKIK